MGENFSQITSLNAPTTYLLELYKTVDTKSIRIKLVDFFVQIKSYLLAKKPHRAHVMMLHHSMEGLRLVTKPISKSLLIGGDDIL